MKTQRRTLTQDEFQQLMALILPEEGRHLGFWVSRWAPEGFGIVPGTSMVWCTPDLHDRMLETLLILSEAPRRTRRIAMGVQGP